MAVLNSGTRTYNCGFLKSWIQPVSSGQFLDGLAHHGDLAHVGQGDPAVGLHVLGLVDLGEFTNLTVT
jgi:hypothetical protein